ncbi:hypothetical protein BH09ACT7_BH09ACT7_17210 [soil metagenome]
MRVSEVAKAGMGCTCRCNACDGGHHCHNIGSGCKIKP